MPKKSQAKSSQKKTTINGMMGSSVQQMGAIHDVMHPKTNKRKSK